MGHARKLFSARVLFVEGADVLPADHLQLRLRFAFNFIYVSTTATAEINHLA